MPAPQCPSIGTGARQGKGGTASPHELAGLRGVCGRPCPGPDRYNAGDTSAEGHATDADVILSDNGNIYRLTGLNGSAGSSFLSFNYDDYSVSMTITPRAIELLDYSADGIANDIGGGDWVHGEAGDDVIHGAAGDDTLYGGAQDDAIYGESGSDWISGGAGADGILGDDGRILTSRNGVAEPLYPSMPRPRRSSPSMPRASAAMCCMPMAN